MPMHVSRLRCAAHNSAPSDVNFLWRRMKGLGLFMQEHYPERMSRCFVINSPGFFNVLWRCAFAHHVVGGNRQTHSSNCPLTAPVHPRPRTLDSLIAVAAWLSHTCTSGRYLDGIDARLLVSRQSHT